MFRACNCRLQKMSSRLKPFTITKKQAMKAMPPKLVERMLYAYRNHPEMGWLEILGDIAEKDPSILVPSLESESL